MANVIGKIEVTDTYGDEANYSWVKRGTTKRTSRKGIIEHVKQVAGWDGWLNRVYTEDHGDFLVVRPAKNAGVAQIAFVYFQSV